LGNLDLQQIFPIGTKIITAHEWLSVQVHPDDAYRQRVERQPFGKTECTSMVRSDRTDRRSAPHGFRRINMR
jgi:mannose-6-phosphate isomerase class I